MKGLRFEQTQTANVWLCTTVQAEGTLECSGVPEG